MAVANTRRRSAPHAPIRARRLRTAVIAIAIVTLSIAPSVAASAARPASLTDDAPQLQALVGDPPELDATFGTGGKVMTNTGGHRAFAVALQSDGKLVVVGEGTDDQFLWLRAVHVERVHRPVLRRGRHRGHLCRARGRRRGRGHPERRQDQSCGDDDLARGPRCCAAGIVRLTTNGTPDGTFDSDGICDDRPVFDRRQCGRDLERRQDPGWQWRFRFWWRDVHDRQVHDHRCARLDVRHGRLRDD